MITEIRGQIYQTITQAARDIGIHPCTITKALDKGTIDFVGFGANYARRKPVWLDGVKYESHAELAAIIGTDRRNVCRWRYEAAKRGQASAKTKWGVLSW